MKHGKSSLQSNIKIQVKNPDIVDQYYIAITTPLKQDIKRLNRIISSAKILEKKKKLMRKYRKAGREELHKELMNLYKFKLKDRYMYALRIIFKGKEFWVNFAMIMGLIIFLIPWVLYFTK